MARKRIKTNALASSHNYESSRKAHRLMLELNHEEHQDFFIEVQQRIVIVDRPKVYTQVKIFGKWVNLDGRDIASFVGFKFK